MAIMPKTYDMRSQISAQQYKTVTVFDLITAPTLTGVKNS